MYTIQKGWLGPHTVGRIGYGAMQLAGPGVFGPPDNPELAREVLRRAIELGVDHIDTSQYYGPDVVNELTRSPHVASVTSLWTAPGPERASLVSKDGTSGLIVAGIAGVGTLIAAHPQALTLVKIGGAAFLIAYGLLAARRAWRPPGRRRAS